MRNRWRSARKGRTLYLCIGTPRGTFAHDCSLLRKATSKASPEQVANLSVSFSTRPICSPSEMRAFVCRTGDVTDGRGRHHSIVSSASLCLGERPRHRYPWHVAVLGKNGLPLQPGNLAAASSQKVQLGCAGAFP